VTGAGAAASRWCLGAVFAAFVAFLYGPTLTILVLSFQGPEGGLTFPMHGLSLHWYARLFAGAGVVDIWAAFGRSLRLGLVVMALTTLIALLGGYAFRRRFRGSGTLFQLVVASLIVPSVAVSLGIALQFRILDDWLRTVSEDHTTAMGLSTSALGAHLTWTLPFGLLVMFAVFNRFPVEVEEAARDLGASPWGAFRYAVLPLVAPSLVGVALFGFTLSWDEIARSSQAMGEANTLPLELQGLTTTATTPEIYALGTLTTGVSALVIAATFNAYTLARRRARRRRAPAQGVRGGAPRDDRAPASAGAIAKAHPLEGRPTP
jgi:putative spermidine/putrescine transport system permease protein